MVSHTEQPFSRLTWPLLGDGARGISMRCKPAIELSPLQGFLKIVWTLHSEVHPPCSRMREKSSRPRCFVQAGPSKTAPSLRPTTKPALVRCVARLLTPDWMSKTNHDHPFVGHHNRCLQLSSYNSKSVEVRWYFRFVQSICMMALCKCPREVVFCMAKSKLYLILSNPMLQLPKSWWQTHQWLVVPCLMPC